MNSLITYLTTCCVALSFLQNTLLQNNQVDNSGSTSNSSTAETQNTTATQSASAIPERRDSTKPGESSPPQVIVVVGAAGTENYRKMYSTWVGRWEQAAKQGGAVFHKLGDLMELSDQTIATPAAKSEDNSVSDKGQLRALCRKLSSQSQSPIWFILIGHGTWDNRDAKFNLKGPDLSAAELKEWLTPISAPLLIINCTSSSSPFLTQLSHKNRVIISATRSGAEQNLTRFGDHLSSAINDLKADLDKDHQISLLEAWLSASRKTAMWYQEQGRLPSEHSLLDDNGDAKGTSADWYQGLHLAQKSSPESLPDGKFAHQFCLVKSGREEDWTPLQLAKRKQLEEELDRLRNQKKTFSTEEYLDRLEKILVPLAELYDSRSK